MKVICLKISFVFFALSLFNAAFSQNSLFYKKKWQYVDSMLQIKVYSKAFNTVNEINQKARAESNSQQIVKCYIYRLKYKKKIKRKTFEKLCLELDSVARNEKFPTNAVLHSMLAEMYWWYYRGIRDELFNISDTSNFDPVNMKTWSHRHLINKIISEYNYSLANKEQLINIGIENYSEIITGNENMFLLEPTLLDFLANRAIDFYSSNDVAVDRPDEYFTLNDPVFFADAKSFLNTSINIKDTTSFQYQAIKIYQDLLSYRIKRKNEPEAFLYVEDKRLGFVRGLSTVKNAQKYYIKAIDKLIDDYIDVPCIAELAFWHAKHYLNLAEKNGYPQFTDDDYWYNDSRENGTKINKEYKNYGKKAYDLCAKIIEKHPNDSVVYNVKVLKQRLEKPFLRVHYDKIIPSGKKTLINIQYNKLDTVYLKIINVDGLDVYSIKVGHVTPNELKKMKRRLRKAELIVVPLPNPETTNAHSIDFILNGLPKGNYRLFLFASKSFEIRRGLFLYEAIQVSDFCYTAKYQADGSSRFLIKHSDTGRPIEGAVCVAKKPNRGYSSRRSRRYNKRYNKRYSSGLDIPDRTYYTDKNGSFVISKEELLTRDFGTIDVTAGKVHLFNIPIHRSDVYKGLERYLRYREEQIFRRNRYSNRVRNLKFFTDRSIYRPGQTIYFKGLLFHHNKMGYRAGAGTTLQIELLNPKNQIVAVLDAKTNDYGTFSGSFDIPTIGLNGAYTISSSQGSIVVWVEEYKRPKNRVEILKDTNRFYLGERGNFTGRTVNYSGASSARAKVQYSIFRSIPWNADFESKYPKRALIKAGEVITNDSGYFFVDYLAYPDLSVRSEDGVYFNYYISVDVTDENGDTYNGGDMHQIGYCNQKIDILFSELINKSVLVHPDSATVEIISKDINNKHISTRGKVEFYKLLDIPVIPRKRNWPCPDTSIYEKKDFYRIVPGNLYMDEENEILNSKGRFVYRKFFNTENSRNLDLSFFQNLATGRYRAEISSIDMHGDTVKLTHNFVLFSERDTKMPIRKPLLFVPLKTYCKPGGKARFLVGSSYENAAISYDIVKGGKIVSSQTFYLNNEQRVVEIPVDEKTKGDFLVHFSLVNNNRVYVGQEVINVPYINKKLKISFETFRDKLIPGQKEIWRLKIKGEDDQKVMAEFLATLYDLSLNRFRSNTWDFNLGYQNINFFEFRADNFSSVSSKYAFSRKSKRVSYDFDYELYGFEQKLNWFDFNENYGNTIRKTSRNRNEAIYKWRKRQRKPHEQRILHGGSEYNILRMEDGMARRAKIEQLKKEKLRLELLKREAINNSEYSDIKLRSNFNETAFFYPHLHTNEDGEVVIEFTVPESLTTWRMMGLANTKDLQFGFITKDFVAQKQLMIQTNEPRFFRKNDRVVLPVTVSNVTNKEITGKARLEFFDAITSEPIYGVIAPTENTEKLFNLPPKGSLKLDWELKIPTKHDAIMYKLVAKSGDFSDGEQRIIPVLSDKELVTQSLPMKVGRNEYKRFKFADLLNSSQSNTIEHKQLFFEFTSNPTWTALLSLPYLMEFPHECNEQLFSRYYANSIALHVLNSNPAIKGIVEKWKKNYQNNKKTFYSRLKNNEAIKSILSEESPWVFREEDHGADLQRLSILFDKNRMELELNSALTKLKESQSKNGFWSWFKGMRANNHISLHILIGFGHLDKLGIDLPMQDPEIVQIIGKAVSALDHTMYKYYRNYQIDLKRLPDYKIKRLPQIVIQYLYMRSFYDFIELKPKHKKAVDFYLDLAAKTYPKNNLYLKAMASLSLYRFNRDLDAFRIVSQIRKQAVIDENNGMFWQKNENGRYWYQSEVETQALMIELFNEVAKDTIAVDNLKTWLLRKKLGGNWKTTKATTAATYALFLCGNNPNKGTELAKIAINNERVDQTALANSKVEAGTGYFQRTWKGDEIVPEMGKIEIENNGNTASWGAMHWQYAENINKISNSGSLIRMEKKLFAERTTKNGVSSFPVNPKTTLKVGDKITVRIRLLLKEDWEYLQLKDMRAAGFEPVDVFSGVRYQDGLMFYQSTKDAATHFFFAEIPKGTYHIEYPLRVVYKGEYESGIATIECMYAPEFRANSNSFKVKAGN